MTDEINNEDPFTPAVVEPVLGDSSTASSSEAADNALTAQFQLPDRPADMSQTDWFNQLADNHKYLHDQIAAIAPINGISGSAQDIRFYQISFKSEATEEQRIAAQATLLTLPEKLKKMRARNAALAAVDAWFAEQIAAGFVASGNLQLGLTTPDITLLTGNFIMAQQAAAMGLAIPPVFDMNGLAHFFANIEELTQVMLAYGQHRANLAVHYAARKAEAEAAFAEPAPEDAATTPTT